MRKPQILVGIQMFLFAVLVAVVLVLPTHSNSLQSFVGLILMFCGALVGLIAIMQHPGGPNVSPEPKQSGQLIQTGLYRWIRHPIYSGVLLGALGMAVFHGHIIAFLIFGIFVAFFTYKSRYEEKLLQVEFDEYVTYRQHTGRFIPPILVQARKEKGE